jgi:hypothetical protein
MVVFGTLKPKSKSFNIYELSSGSSIYKVYWYDQIREPKLGGPFRGTFRAKFLHRVANNFQIDEIISYGGHAGFRVKCIGKLDKKISFYDVLKICEQLKNKNRYMVEELGVPVTFKNVDILNS